MDFSLITELSALALSVRCKTVTAEHRNGKLLVAIGKGQSKRVFYYKR